MQSERKMKMTEVKERLNELRTFLSAGIRYSDWMEKKFQEHPDLIKFPLEEVPMLIAKGVAQSKLGEIDGTIIKGHHQGLESFSFGVPFSISETDTVGSWGDLHTSSGKLFFHIGYGKGNQLSINASYDAVHLHVYNGVIFTVAHYENTIVNYVRNLCNGLKNTQKIS